MDSNRDERRDCLETSNPLKKAFDEYLLCKDDAVWAGNDEEARAKEEAKIEKRWMSFENLLRESMKNG